MELTFDIDEEVAQEFEEVQKELKQRYPDEPFDEDEFVESRIREFNAKQRKLLGVMSYSDA